MNTKTLCTALIIFALIFSSNVTFASTNTDSEGFLQQQLTALTRYVQKVVSFLSPVNQTKVSNDALRTAITDGVAWLRESQEESGHFAYEYLPYEDDYLSGDNIVRQTGALYAMSELVRRTSKKDEKTNEAIEQAIAYFDSLSPEHTYEGETIRCVTKNEESYICQLGATALALTGILGYIEAEPTKANEYKTLIEGYVSFILKSKIPNAGFRNVYRIGIGFQGATESSFSNGEALLALVRYYQYSPDTEVKKVIDETFTYIQGKEFDTALYLWAMAAVKDMQVLWPNEMYTTYGKEFTNWRLGLLVSARSTNRNYCASTEGLVSAYSLLKDSTTESDQERLRKEIDFWNAKNLDFQIGGEDMYRLTQNTDGLALLKVQNMQKGKGGFLTADDELTQRIDFTQHCVSAYLQTLVDVDGQVI
jgi:hypothetical protein